MLDEIKAGIEEKIETRKREVDAALERGEMAGPIFGVPFLISLAISASLSAASYFISRAFAPKPPIRQVGDMAGQDFQVMASEMGLMISEVYGRDPGDGYGGCRLAPIIPWTSGLRRNVSVTRQEVGGGKGPPSQTVTTENVTYDLDIDLMHCRGPAETVVLYANTDVVLDRRTGRFTGVLDDTITPDDDYDQDTLPDPEIAYERPGDRHNGALVVDGDGVGTGIVLQGGYSSIADYPGSTDQPVDPVIQAEVDGRLGAGSTPAFRGKHHTRFSGFQLTRWGGILPNFTGVHQHETIATLEDLCDAMCERVGMESGDYDFSALSGIDLRGLLIAGRRYQPREVMEVCARVFNFYFCETVDGQLVGRLQDEAATLTIADTEMGWVAGELEDGQPIPELGSNVPDEMTLPRRIDVKYVDPEKEFEPNLQTAARQITTGVDEQSLEIQITMLADEAREVAERELYQEHVEGTKHRLTLPWTYLYLDPGRVIQVNRAEGFSHTIRASGIKGGVSLLDVDGYAIETAVYTQPAVGDGGTGFEQPPVPIPAMTVAVLLDTPLLRDKDITTNDGLGFYWGACPRTGDDQVWQGAALYVNKVGDEKIAETTLPATLGVVVATNVVSTPSHYAMDADATITVDLYGTTAALESVTAADIAGGANGAAIGNKVIQFLSAVRDADPNHPNRWTVSQIYWGRRGTEQLLAAPEVGETFVLLNEAVQFVPRPRADVGTTKEYRAVTAGQSVDDAAAIEWTWIGRSLYPLAIAGIDTDETTQLAPRDSAGSILITARPRSNFAQLGDEYLFEALSDDGLTVMHSFSFREGIHTAALLESSGANKYTDITTNTLSHAGSSTVNARTLQVVRRPGNYVEGTLEIDGFVGTAGLGFQSAPGPWPTDEMTNAEVFCHLSYFTLDLQEGYWLTVRVGRGAATTNYFLGDGEEYASQTVRVLLTAGGEVRFYQNWQSPSTTPFHVGQLVMPYPLRGVAQVYGGGDAAHVRKMVVSTDPYPTTIYSDVQQLAHSFGIKNPLRARIRQYSGVREVGYGFPFETFL